jgi:isocitrate/isopropylmalate dehydrogenase
MVWLSQSKFSELEQVAFDYARRERRRISVNKENVMTSPRKI